MITAKEIKEMLTKERMALIDASARQDAALTEFDQSMRDMEVARDDWYLEREAVAQHRYSVTVLLDMLIEMGAKE